MGSTWKYRLTKSLAAMGFLLVSMASGLPVASGEDEFVQVKVHRVVVEPVSNQAVVVLVDFRENAALPVWIGNFEANAIHSEIEGIRHFRPLTHDLLQMIIQKANIKLQRVAITHLKESVYYATITIEMGGSPIEIDARPSDSIVMAMKFKAPIFVSKSLFGDKSVPLTEGKDIEEDYGLTLQDLTPSLADAFSFEPRRGILVSDVRDGSQAHRDGIERGDIFVEVGGQPVEDPASLRNALKKAKASLQARIFRKSRFYSISLHPEEGRLD